MCTKRCLARVIRLIRMNILQCNKFFRIHGGADYHFFALSKLLEERSHTVIPFAVAHADNAHSELSRYFVRDIFSGKCSGKVPSPLSLWPKAAEAVYSFEARRKISRLIDEHRIDLAHIHNIYHHITPQYPTANMIYDSIPYLALPYKTPHHLTSH